MRSFLKELYLHWPESSQGLISHEIGYWQCGHPRLLLWLPGGVCDDILLDVAIFFPYTVLGNSFSIQGARTTTYSVLAWLGLIFVGVGTH